MRPLRTFKLSEVVLPAWPGLPATEPSMCTGVFRNAPSTECRIVSPLIPSTVAVNFALSATG